MAAGALSLNMATVFTAFQCMLTLPLNMLILRCVDVTGAYSAQKTELNISLTAIGLLWTTTDFIVKGLLHGPTEGKETG